MLSSAPFWGQKQQHTDSSRFFHFLQPLTLHRSLGSVVASTSLQRPFPVTAALASGGGASAKRQLRETILAVTALSSTPVLLRISRSRSSPRSERCVGGKGGTERAVGVAPRGVEQQEEEALLTSPRASPVFEEAATLAESPLPAVVSLHEVASGLSGVGGPERESEDFILRGWLRSSFREEGARTRARERKRGEVGSAFFLCPQMQKNEEGRKKKQE